MISHITQFLCFSSILVATTSLCFGETTVEARFEKELLPFFAKHCFRCHGAENQDGAFRADALSHDVGGGPHVNKWQEVIGKLSSNEMPPPEEENRPTAEEVSEVVEWLNARIKEGEAARLARRERVSFHRLTREEYANTVYDLLGVHFDVADPTGLTEDADWHGFEKIGSVQTLSASHIEKYFAAAEELLAEAYPEKELESSISRKAALDLRGGPSQEKIRELEAAGLADKVRIDMWPGHNIQGGRPGPANREMFKNGGVYKVRIQVSGLKPIGGRAPHLTFYADKLDRMLFEQDISAPEDKPIVVEFETHLPAGSHSFRLTNDVPGPSILPRSGRSGRRPFISLKDGRIPWQLKLTDEEGVPLYPFLIVDWVEWEGPIQTDDEKQKRLAYMPTDPSDLNQVRECFRKFLAKAFRRPASSQEVEQYVSLVEREIAAGEKPKAAVKTAMLAVLCSKNFLYLVEGGAGREVGKLNDWELASRLSYFLWSSMPDETLFQLAENGTLHQPEILREQVTRMLADPRAGAFAKAFPYQWLQLKKVGMFAPDSKLYPDYDDHLEQSMVEETTSFFQEALNQNLSLREFLDSDWTMVNARLAIHYGMSGVEGDSFRRVQLQPEQGRSGILTHASVLSLTSDGQRHRPVHRGVWLSESILGKSPPPPPANVEPIKPNPVDAPKATLRMKLAAHKSDPNCAACHRKIDPLGLAFEHFDAIGRWRTEEIVSQGTGKNPSVDASGELPDGRKFADHSEFKKLMLQDIHKFNQTFVKKLATFGVRRAMTVDDQEDLATIAAASKQADYRLKNVIEAFVLSELFLKR
jgi:mono/diheme cytochrome c family protein